MLEGIAFLDDATRPHAPALPDATDAQRESGRHLAAVHRYHLSELAKVRRALDAFLAGTGTAEAIADSVSTMTMLENYRRFGALCGNACQLLNLHHTIEDRAIFPRLREHAPMRAVVDRLAAEHLTVHALIERLEKAARDVSFQPDSEQFAKLREVYEALERVVLSHFGYEERELESALGYYGIDL